MSRQVSRIAAILEPKPKIPMIHLEKECPDGTHVEYTCYKQNGETPAEFARRCREEWEAICEAFCGE